MMRNAALPVLAAVIPLLIRAQTTEHATVPASPLPTITVTPASPERIFAYTNGVSAFWCGIVNGPSTSGFHGITRAKRHLLHDVWIALGDSLLDRRASVTEVTPAGFTRRYPAWETVERVCFVDSLTLLVIEVETRYPGDVTVVPGWSAGFAGGEGSMHGHTFRITAPAAEGGGPVPAGVARIFGAHGAWEAPDARLIDALEGAGRPHIPVCFRGSIASTRMLVTIEFPMDAADAPRPPDEVRERCERKAVRIATSLQRLDFESSNSMQAAAVPWIAASLDALSMQQSGAGLYAGLPWFDDYWGRDLFISLPGALLSTGRYEDAARVLRSFAEYQQRDPTHPDAGRIPNRVQPGEIIYNTADGTPWFVLAAWRTIRAGGDMVLARDLLPVLERAIDGALRHRVDAGGLLTHGDSDTWMDAVGPAGPWSPRGNRAVEIQALWYAQLRASASLASLLGERARATAWNRHADRVRESFRSGFIDDDGALADRLLADGTRDLRPRPNVLLAAMVGGDLLPDTLWRAAVSRAIRTCVFPWGVASLGPADSVFHPWHVAPEFYVKDAAYHNGTIWTWLSGAAASALCRFGAPDSAAVLMHALERLALDVGAVGALPECLDALPRHGRMEPEWSGTFSQAWSMAEYLRVLHDELLGMHPLVFRGESLLGLSPQLPSHIDRIAMRTRAGHAYAHVTYIREASGWRAVIAHLGGPVLTVGLGATPDDDGFVRVARLLAGDTVSIAIGTSGRQPEASIRVPFLHVPPGMTWPSVQPPSHRRLSGAEISMRNPSARLVLQAADPAGDDRGPDGGYSYPASAHFVDGILDIRSVSLHADDRNAYFTITMRALTQPGWNPACGFQLTLLALAIDEGRDAGSQAMNVGLNSGWRMGGGRGFDRLLLVGGGIRVEDMRGRILGEYVPVDPRFAFGDPRTGEIRFSLPLEVIGRPTRDWRITVLCGAQDDHGGAGLGVFRTVMPERGEWNGGGRTAGQPNVYDVLVVAP